MIKLPASEVLDRYTITLLKMIHTNENVAEELLAYRREINNYPIKLKPIIQKYVVRLFLANLDFWNLESSLRRDNEEKASLKETGKNAIKIRDLNMKRNSIKTEIAKVICPKLGEISFNYDKLTYKEKENENAYL